MESRSSGPARGPRAGPRDELTRKYGRTIPLATPMA
jgi:hypothetical protein